MPARETVADVFLETLHQMGIRYLFSNLGTDYPPLVESLAKYESLDVALPEMMICAHENTAITAAHGYALATGQGQGVFVHVGVGTQNLGGGLHNAFVARVPMYIFAGKSPLATRGEMLGSRDNSIHYLQDIRDQTGIVRQFVKWDFNLEIAEQAAYAFQRGARIMQSEPRGPVYVTAAREVLGFAAPERESDPPGWSAQPELGELPQPVAQRLAAALHAAERPLIVTSYLGRNGEAVGLLVRLSELLQIPISEPGATVLNFPRNHPNHWGFRNSGAEKEADLIVLIDTDVPWVPKAGAPKPDTPVVQIDLDPLKRHITIWDFPVTESHRVDSRLALARILEHAERLPAFSAEHQALRQRWLASHPPPIPPVPSDGRLTVPSLSALLGSELPSDSVIFDEGVTSADAIRFLCPRSEPGSFFGLPGGSLGWGGGAALGHKLAKPEKETVALLGDGSFLFNVPSSLYMTAQRYGIPFLTVIYNNGGWNAVKTATTRVYAGRKSKAVDQGAFRHDLTPGDNLEQVAAGFGCYTAKATDLDSMRTALAAGRQAVAEGRCAVINALVEMP